MPCNLILGTAALRKIPQCSMRLTHVYRIAALGCQRINKVIEYHHLNLPSEQKGAGIFCEIEVT